MGQRNDSGRNASLDDKKKRAAGRSEEERNSSLDHLSRDKGGAQPVGGAFGGEPQGAGGDVTGDDREGGSNLSKGGGGGGGAGPAQAKD